jgi:hypothetical protein
VENRPQDRSGPDQHYLEAAQPERDREGDPTEQGLLGQDICAHRNIPPDSHIDPVRNACEMATLAKVSRWKHGRESRPRHYSTQYPARSKPERVDVDEFDVGERPEQALDPEIDGFQ